jgi:hypothetical protein
LLLFFADLQSPQEIAEALKRELANIPEVNYRSLKVLFGLLRKVAENQPKTLMTPDNLAVVFHPTLNLRMELIVDLIVHYYDVFSD